VHRQGAGTFAYATGIKSVVVRPRAESPGIKSVASAPAREMHRSQVYCQRSRAQGSTEVRCIGIGTGSEPRRNQEYWLPRVAATRQPRLFRIFIFPANEHFFRCTGILRCQGCGGDAVTVIAAPQSKGAEGTSGQRIGPLVRGGRSPAPLASPSQGRRPHSLVQRVAAGTFARALPSAAQRS
jgi:hypothetical protein